MIHEVPTAIYINDEETIDISLNSLPLSVEITPHNASVIVINDIRRNTSNVDYVNTIAYKCKAFIFMMFSFSILASLMTFLFLSK